MAAPLERAIDGWRKTRHVRFAAIAELATKRALPTPRSVVGDSGKAVDARAWQALYEERDVLDLPRLFAAVGGGKSAMAAERVTLLARLDDPRVVSGVLALLEAPPYRAQTALPFFRACAKALVESNDPRARPALEALAARYKSILETSVGDVVANLLQRAAESMDLVKPGPLPAKYEALATELEALFEVERATAESQQATKRSAEQNDDALLAAIYAAPEDDGPRLVFADALAERGDVRGEFIALQLHRARGEVSRERFVRERALVRDPKQRAAFALPLSRGGQPKLERGFPATLQVDAKTVKHIVGSPALQTLTRITWLESLSNKLAREVVQHAHARNVTRVGSFRREQFDALVGELPWHHIGLQFLPGAHDVARMTRVERLSVTATAGDATPRVDLSRLKHFSLRGVAPEGTVSLAKNASSLELFVRQAWPEFLVHELRTLAALRELEVEYLPLANDLAGLPLERLEGRYTYDVDLVALFDALPTLRHLVVSSDHSSVDMAKKLAAAAPRLKQLESLQFAEFRFHRPGTPEASLTLELSNSMTQSFERLGEALKVLPGGLAPKAVLKHRQHEDPAVHFIDAPKPELLALLQTNRRMPVELDWY